MPLLTTLIDHYVGVANGSRGIRVFLSTHLVVVDRGIAIVFVPNFDAEQVYVDTGGSFASMAVSMKP